MGMRMIIVIVAILGVTSSGCAELFGESSAGEERPRAPRPMVTVKYRQPSLTPVDAAKSLQERSGVTISVSAAPFALQRAVKKVYRQLPTVVVMNNQYPYEVRTIPMYTATPDRLRLVVTVVNNQEQILRLAGSLVRFNVNGSEVALDGGSSDIGRFAEAILAPRDQKQFEITGPRWSELPPECTVGLMIFGVVTETDEAGTAKKRGNFEWFYRFAASTEEREEPLLVQTVRLQPHQVPAGGESD